MHAAPADNSCSHSGILQRLDLDPFRLGPLGAIGVGDDLREPRALLRRDDHEPPRRELAVIGGARGDGAHFLELRHVRAGRGEIARLARAAGGEQRERGGAIVEHRPALAAPLAYLQRPLCR